MAEPHTPLPPKIDRTGDERTVLGDFLELYRTIFRRKAEGLSREEMAITVGASPLTIAGLVKHMALVEDTWFTKRFADGAVAEPWSSAPFDREPDWELESAVHDEPADLFRWFDEARARSRAVEAGAGLDDVAAFSDRDGDPISLRWIIVHMIEEYARHVGHLDLLRETADGTVGD